MELKKKYVVFAGIIAIVAILLTQLSVTRTVEKYRVGNLVVASPGGTRGDWNKMDDNETTLAYAVSTENNTLVVNEFIVVRYRKDVGTIPSEGASEHLSPGKAKLARVLGFKLQKSVQEGFEVGKGSSFTEIAGADAYRFELIKREVPAQYTLDIVIWKEDWYFITYVSSGTTPGPHLPDFEAFLEELEFV